MKVNIKSELNKYHWRLFGSEDILFLFVCEIDEAEIYVTSKKERGFIPMSSHDRRWGVNKEDIDFKICEKIIHEEEGWKKEVLLHHSSETKFLRGLCKAILDPSIEELKCHHPSGLRPIAARN